MNDRSYAKLFSTIVTSSLWCEDSDSRVVWVTMLALADESGRVVACAAGLARIANVASAACGRALTRLLSPDQYSESVAHEGRRIEEVDGGWRILDWDMYSSSRPLPLSDRSGFVYLLGSEIGLYKIGRTKNPEFRTCCLMRQGPTKAWIECIVPSDDCVALEAALHKQFAKKRANGEWFALELGDVKTIKDLTVESPNAAQVSGVI